MLTQFFRGKSARSSPMLHEHFNFHEVLVSKRNIDMEMSVGTQHSKLVELYIELRKMGV